MADFRPYDVLFKQRWTMDRTQIYRVEFTQATRAIVKDKLATHSPESRPMTGSKIPLSLENHTNVL